MFNSLIGNEQIKTVLRRMLENQRIPGSLIFAGDDGVGKKRFAFELAKAVLCRAPQGVEACEKCANCLRIDKIELPKLLDKDSNERIFFTQHTDVGYVRKAGKFVTVETIRGLQAEASFAPYEGGNRFFIVDDADEMNEAAANALLKTLEEPAATTHLILIAARLDALLPTIRSRCQVLRFAAISTPEIEKKLTASEKISPNDVKVLARIARGSLSKALSINFEKFKEQREQMFIALDALTAAKNRALLLKIAEEMNDAKIKDEYEIRLEILETLIHDVWLLGLGAEPEKIINLDLQNKLFKLTNISSVKKLRNWLAEIELLRENLTVNLNRKIATDALFMRLSQN